MKRELVPDELWERVVPLLPRHRHRRGRGRPPRDDRACLRGIIFVLKTGIAWRDLPAEVFGCSGATCWRRLRQWGRAGVFEKLQRQLLNELGQQGLIDWSRAAFDSSSVRAEKGGKQTGPNPTDRGKAGSKHHLVVDRKGLPLAILLSAANVHDKRKALPLLDAILPIKGPRGRPRRRPAKGHGDKGYDYADVRRSLRKRHIIPRIARRGIESKERLGRHRWVVERSLGWVHTMKRLRVREERSAQMHLSLLRLGCCLILYRELERHLRDGP
ncbi:IS5 family transposase [Archangium minus]|uniref:IS5 family transposase n=1 Tax=Archangium minus TaxID=83450 RepID=A0ABY9X047_9BACT|nr:IS5 family transposase [Archangium violaceum]WNG35108.1 IS5 family transposase [Archangium violaceum]WNG48772.1 IS5 family transposase [Archangium minus]